MSKHRLVDEYSQQLYSKYSKNEKKLIGKIYTAIGNAIADERLREALISNIEDQITK